MSTEGLVDRPGVVGELYIGGPQLMAGYLNDPARSAAVLRTDVIEGTTLYRTGDLVFRDDRGNYVYVGRSDRVIKRHGVRMSLVEVTEALGGIDGVASAACTTFDLEGDLGVVAFVVPDRELTPLAVRQAASQRLPADDAARSLRLGGRLALDVVQQGRRATAADGRWLVSAEARRLSRQCRRNSVIWRSTRL